MKSIVDSHIPSPDVWIDGDGGMRSKSMVCFLSIRVVAPRLRVTPVTDSTCA
jgi:hypothetical protein